MSERDPRVDPVVGDVLRKAGETRVVESLRRRKDRQTYACQTKCTAVSRVYPWTGYPNIDQWRKWAKTAEVIHRADDGSAGGAQKEQQNA